MSVRPCLFMLAYLIASAVLSCSTYLNVKLFRCSETRKGRHSWRRAYSPQVSECYIFLGGASYPLIRRYFS